MRCLLLTPQVVVAVVVARSDGRGGERGASSLGRRL